MLEGDAAVVLVLLLVVAAGVTAVVEGTSPDVVLAELELLADDGEDGEVEVLVEGAEGSGVTAVAGEPRIPSIDFINAKTWFIIFTIEVKRGWFGVVGSPSAESQTHS